MVKDLCDDGNLNHDNLIKFMLSARKLYRNVPYHNFDHAFNFMHCMYNILKRNKTTFSSFEVSTYLSLNFSSLFVNIVWWQNTWRVKFFESFTTCLHIKLQWEDLRIFHHNLFSETENSISIFTFLKM